MCVCWGALVLTSPSSREVGVSPVGSAAPGRSLPWGEVDIAQGLCSPLATSVCTLKGCVFQFLPLETCVYLKNMDIKNGCGGLSRLCIK